MADQLKQGDVVTLNSGSVEMTIHAINMHYGTHTCIWYDFDTNSVKHFDFYAHDLKKKD